MAGSGSNNHPTSGGDGIDRAAILLMSLGEEAAAEVMKHMSPKEVQKISSRMATLNNISREQVGGVLTEFCATVDEQTALGVGSSDYVRNVLVQALGQDKANGVIDQIEMGTTTAGLEQLKWMDPRGIADFIKLEHPQIISVVLSYLDSEISSEVLCQLDEKLQIDVMLRIASLDVIHPSALNELNNIMEKQFQGNTNIKSSAVGGVKRAANILNLMDPSVEVKLMDKLKEFDAELGDEIEELMFVFADLIELDGRAIQALLREVSTDTLLLAMKGADQELNEKIYSNMSKRAGEMLRDDLEAKGPVRLSEVEEAQKEILSISRRMAESGEISLGGKGAEEYV